MQSATLQMHIAFVHYKVTVEQLLLLLILLDSGPDSLLIVLSDLRN